MMQRRVYVRSEIGDEDQQAWRVTKDRIAENLDHSIEPKHRTDRREM